MDKIRQPAQVERLLETFAARSDLLPQGAHRIRDPQAMPQELQRVLTHVRGQAWVCFSEDSQAWLFTGVLSRDLSRERNAPVLLVNYYGLDGVLMDIGAWTVEQDGTWRKCGA